MSPQIPPNAFRLLTIAQAAEQMSVSISTVSRLIRSGELPSVTLGRCRRIPSTVIEQYAASLLASLSDPSRIMQT